MHMQPRMLSGLKPKSHASTLDVPLAESGQSAWPLTSPFPVLMHAQEEEVRRSQAQVCRLPTTEPPLHLARAARCAAINLDRHGHEPESEL